MFGFSAEMEAGRRGNTSAAARAGFHGLPAQITAAGTGWLLRLALFFDATPRG
jgi:hypothetical protein